MMLFHNLCCAYSKKIFDAKSKTWVVLFSFLIACQISSKADAQVNFEGSWGGRLHVRGGERLDEFVDNGYDYVAGAQEIVDNYPTMGHVITNFTNSAFPHLFLLRNNENVDAVMGSPGSIISEEFVPSLENEQIIFDVINILKAANKKVILYINCIDIGKMASTEGKAAWNAYVNQYFSGSTHKATMNLLEGYAKRFTELGIDSYWLDAYSSYPGTPAEKSELVQMLRNTTPNVAISTNLSKDYIVDENGAQIFVDTDGLNDSNDLEYRVIEYVGNDQWSDYTHGHITPLKLGAPPSSWAYEEFTIPAIQESAISTSTNNSKLVVKHMWAPMRETWTSERTELMFTKEQAYRFVKNITEAGGMFTFASTIDDGSNPADEEAILKYVDQKMAENEVDFTPYTRPAGAFLVGEQAKTAQSIRFSAIPSKQVGDADFSPGATSSSGLTVSYISSNPKIAIIVNNKIRIVGSGVARITARQNGNNQYRHAPFVTKLLTVGQGSAPTADNLAIYGTPSQSSNHPDGNGEAYRANDGDTNGIYAQGSVTRTAPEKDPWWQVDLGEEYSIDQIKVFGRSDACCDTRLSDFEVIVLDGEGNTTLTRRYTTAPSPYRTVNANGVKGQTIKIQQYHTGMVLNLAEVEVYGTSVEKQEQDITFPPFSGFEVGDSDFDPDVTASSGLPVTYTSGNTSVAVIVGNKIRIIAEGQTNITASQLGNTVFNAAQNRSRVLTVSPASTKTTLVHLTKRNAQGFALDGNWGGADGQNIYQYSQDPNNLNQQWIEIDRGDGYYSYQKNDTEFCVDGGMDGANNQNVYLWTCVESNENQHWQKVDSGGGSFKLIKRNAPGFAISGGPGGSNSQNVFLWNSAVTNQNLNWMITPLE